MAFTICCSSLIHFQGTCPQSGRRRVETKAELLATRSFMLRSWSGKGPIVPVILDLMKRNSAQENRSGTIMFLGAFWCTASFQVLTGMIIKMIKSFIINFISLLEHCVTVFRISQNCGSSCHWTSGEICMLQDKVDYALWILHAIV